mgnify:CR=1 FL=1
MSLLTTEEYKAIAARLEFPTQAFIDGAFRPAIKGKTFTGKATHLSSVVDPATRAAEARIELDDPANERLPTDPDDPRIIDADGAE